MSREHQIARGSVQQCVPTNGGRYTDSPANSLLATAHFEVRLYLLGALEWPHHSRLRLRPGLQHLLPLLATHNSLQCAEAHSLRIGDREELQHPHQQKTVPLQ